MQFTTAFLLLSMLAFVSSERDRPGIRKVKEREDAISEEDVLHDFLIDEEEVDDNEKETEDEDETDETEEVEDIDTGKCTKDQLSYFPHRLREWFFIITQEVNRKTEEDEDILLPIKETNDSPNDRKWVDAVLWKFCDLDVKPHNRYLSRDELSILRDPLVSMEPCIDPFLAKCDTNGDAQITLQEWGLCIGLEDDEIQDKCKVPKDLDLK